MKKKNQLQYESWHSFMAYYFEIGTWKNISIAINTVGINYLIKKMLILVYKMVVMVENIY